MKLFEESMGLSHCVSHRILNTRIKCLRQNVIRIQIILRHKTRNRLSCRNLHRIINIGSPHIQRPTENSRETEDVIHLIREIGTPGSHIFALV